MGAAAFLPSWFWVHCPLYTLLAPALVDRPTDRSGGKGNGGKGKKGKTSARWKTVDTLPPNKADWTQTDHMVARRAKQQQQQQQKRKASD